MKLRTHTAYNEGQFDVNSGKWHVRIYDGEGHVKEQQTGQAEAGNEAAIRAAMNAFVASVEPKYRK